MAAVREEARMRAAASLLGSSHQGPALCRGVEVACYRCPVADAIVNRDLMTSGGGAYWITRTCETSARALPNPGGSSESQELLNKEFFRRGPPHVVARKLHVSNTSEFTTSLVPIVSSA
jgi:hypothetical protein